MSRVSVERNPSVIDYAQTGLVLAVGYAMLAPGADGQSAFGHIMGALRGGLATIGPPAGTQPQTPSGTPTPGASSGNTYGPGNTNPSAPDVFNINTDAAVSQWHLDQANIIGGGGLGSNPTNPTISGHIGLGHAGRGGTFTLVLWGQSLGIFFGIGGGGIVNLWQTDLVVGGDNNWTGYGVDFAGVPVAAVSGPGQTKVWATIYDGGGVAYTTAVIAGRGGLAAGGP